LKNPAPYIQKAFYDLLRDQVVYKSANVPVKESGGKRVVPFMILIGEFTWTDRSTKHSFSGRGSQLITIVDEGTGTLHHGNVDAIGNEVMDLIIPTPRTVIDGDQFQITALRKRSQNYLDEPGGDGGYVTRLLLRYDFLINQTIIYS
jgi:hypothetical protein